MHAAWPNCSFLQMGVSGGIAFPSSVISGANEHLEQEHWPGAQVQLVQVHPALPQPPIVVD